jgi:hypothetical protein
MFCELRVVHNREPAYHRRPSLLSRAA